MNILITGSGSGLGACLASTLRLDNHRIYEFDKQAGCDVRHPESAVPSSYAQGAPDDLDVLINCAGVNKMGWLENVREEDWYETIDVNAGGIFKMSKWSLSVLSRRQGTILNIISNAAYVPMTCTLAYGASKAAAHLMTLQLARELGRKYGMTVFGVAPNKLKGTGMSRAVERQVIAQRGWTTEQAVEHQLAVLPAGAETPPESVADFIAFLLSSKERHRYLAGCILPYGG